MSCGWAIQHDNDLKHTARISETLEKISTNLEGQSKCITEVEQRVSDIEDYMAGLETRLAETEKKVKQMADVMDDLENHCRRDNIRVLNLEEGTEGKNPIHCIKIDRAHRSLGTRGARPQPVIIALHNSRDKPRILAATRAKPNLEYEGRRIFIHQDLSSAVRERRRAFNVCKALIDKRIRFNMRYPAVLSINLNGTEHRFQTRSEAEDFLKTLE
uniref:L1 transposable element RRM domain-containing protein n=1 Tax=Amphilophus citrinellus TaxID=61819 RepID=A0A3Q0SXH5_AMPCI